MQLTGSASCGGEASELAMARSPCPACVISPPKRDWDHVDQHVCQEERRPPRSPSPDPDFRAHCQSSLSCEAVLSTKYWVRTPPSLVCLRDACSVSSTRVGVLGVESLVLQIRSLELSKQSHGQG